MQRLRRFTFLSLVSAGLVASAAGAVANLGFASTALASGSTKPICGPKPLLPCDRLAVTGPIAAAAGASFPLRARGYANQKVGAPNPADAVVGWNTALPCQTKYPQEVSAQGSTAANLDIPVSGRFLKAYTVPTNSLTLPAGTSHEKMYWCVYLINSTKKTTFKAAFWTYTVLGHSGPGGPGGGP